MAKASFVNEGKTIKYRTQEQAVAYGDIVVLGDSRVGVAGMDIPVTSEGTVCVTGVYRFPKATSGVSFKAGGSVYFNKASGLATTTKTDVPAGFATADAEATDAVVYVKIG